MSSTQNSDDPVIAFVCQAASKSIGRMTEFSATSDPSSS